MENGYFKDTVEYTERVTGEVIQARNNALDKLRDYGPPDMCYVIKTDVKSRTKEVSSYHFVSGVDCSSSASIAAYVNSLTYSLNKGGKGNEWTISNCIFCCYNGFSKVDVRVKVNFPGSVEAFYATSAGESRAKMDQKFWDETHVSSVVRAILIMKNSEEKVDSATSYAVMHIDPIQSPSAERDFLQSVKNVFLDGAKLGANRLVFKPSVIENNLLSALRYYFFGCGRGAKLLQFLKTLKFEILDLSPVLASCYIEIDEETNAVKCLYNSLKDGPNSCEALITQIDYLRTKKRYDLALQVANYAIIHFCLEFRCWERLAHTYVDLEDYTSALLAVNNAPVYSRPVPGNMVRLKSIKEHSNVRSLLGKNSSVHAKGAPKVQRNVYAHSSLARCKCPNDLRGLSFVSLHGIQKRIYNILIRIYSKIGWNGLLKYRQEVFIMQGDYSLYNENTKIKGVSATSSSMRLHRPSSPVESKDLKHSPHEAKNENPESPPEKLENNSPSPKSVSRAHLDSPNLPSEDDHNEHNDDHNEHNDDHNDHEDDHNEHNDDHEDDHKNEEIIHKGSTEALKGSSSDKLDSADIQKVTTTLSPDAQNASEFSAAPSGDHELSPKENKSEGKSSSDISAIMSKFICERWLDDMFFVMYVDMGCLLWYRKELESQRVKSKGNMHDFAESMTGADWEIYGDLELQFGNTKDASEAYRFCMTQSDSLEPRVKLLKILCESNKIIDSLGLIIGILTYNYNNYAENIYPSAVAECIFNFIKRNGLTKVQNYLISLNLSKEEYQLVTRYFDYAEFFGVPGAYL